MTSRRKDRERAKGRRESGPFIALPISVLNDPNYFRLKPNAVKLLVDMCTQIHFSRGGPVNNGDVSIPWSRMSKRGWRSKQTLRNAELELLHYGFIRLTRQGGRNKCNLYAITWWAIDECKGKLDVKETKTAPNDWKEGKENYQRAKPVKTGTPNIVPTSPPNRTNHGHESH